MRVTQADGHALYLVDANGQLKLSMLTIESLGLSISAHSERGAAPEPASVGVLESSVVARSAAAGVAIHIPDIYATAEVDSSAQRAFDAHYAYRSQSLLAAPMKSHERGIIGVLLLINARDPASGDVVPFSDDAREVTLSLASQAAVAMEELFAFEKLREFNKNLEATVEERTADLTVRNEELRREITQRKQAEARTQYLAYYDELTGLPNRQFFKELLARAIHQAERGKRMVGLMFVDLDCFKEVNDTLGHPVGDLLLQSVAARLKRCVRSVDSVSRPGKDAEPQTYRVLEETSSRPCSWAFVTFRKPPRWRNGS